MAAVLAGDALELRDLDRHRAVEHADVPGTRAQGLARGQFAPHHVAGQFDPGSPGTADPPQSQAVFGGAGPYLHTGRPGHEAGPAQQVTLILVTDVHAEDAARSLRRERDDARF